MLITAQKAERGLRPGGPGVFRGGVLAAFSSCAGRGFSVALRARIAARTSPGAAGRTTFALQTTFLICSTQHELLWKHAAFSAVC